MPELYCLQEHDVRANTKSSAIISHLLEKFPHGVPRLEGEAKKRMVTSSRKVQPRSQNRERPERVATKGAIVETASANPLRRSGRLVTSSRRTRQSLSSKEEAVGLRPESASACGSPKGADGHSSERRGDVENDVPLFVQGSSARSRRLSEPETSTSSPAISNESTHQDALSCPDNVVSANVLENSAPELGPLGDVGDEDDIPPGDENVPPVAPPGFGWQADFRGPWPPSTRLHQTTPPTPLSRRSDSEEETGLPLPSMPFAAIDDDGQGARQPWIPTERVRRYSPPSGFVLKPEPVTPTLGDEAEHFIKDTLANASTYYSTEHPLKVRGATRKNARKLLREMKGYADDYVAIQGQMDDAVELARLARQDLIALDKKLQEVRRWRRLIERHFLGKLKEDSRLMDGTWTKAGPSGSKPAQFQEEEQMAVEVRKAGKLLCEGPEALQQENIDDDEIPWPNSDTPLGALINQPPLLVLPWNFDTSNCGGEFDENDSDSGDSDRADSAILVLDTDDEEDPAGTVTSPTAHGDTTARPQSESGTESAGQLAAKNAAKSVSPRSVPVESSSGPAPQPSTSVKVPSSNKSAALKRRRDELSDTESIASNDTSASREMEDLDTSPKRLRQRS
ncbi:hypothetical protein NM688_g649 [Phlebia brevispora]|uniref:Uncharacterized protein n=1 Tax=Phlebia brevispora TaxID=194682 RepID=A0ACC1TDI3_9APHY|nr:hypothetical protein NM688_g649 [Phlebia brevispora]